MQDQAMPQGGMGGGGYAPPRPVISMSKEDVSRYYRVDSVKIGNDRKVINGKLKPDGPRFVDVLHNVFGKKSGNFINRIDN